MYIYIYIVTCLQNDLFTACTATNSCTYKFYAHIRTGTLKPNLTRDHYKMCIRRHTTYDDIFL